MTLRQPAYEIPTFLPGRLALSRGGPGDYSELARFHYRGGTPATFAETWSVHFLPHDNTGPDAAPRDPKLVAVATLAFPVPALHARDRALNLVQMDERAKLRWLNRNLRTISRVAVHPTFRSLGLARVLVRCLIHHCRVRYVEALAVMGRFTPFFESAGMTCHRPEPTAAHRAPKPYYYLFDREAADAGFDLPAWRERRKPSPEWLSVIRARA